MPRKVAATTAVSDRRIPLSVVKIPRQKKGKTSLTINSSFRSSSSEEVVTKTKTVPVRPLGPASPLPWNEPIPQLLQQQVATQRRTGAQRRRNNVVSKRSNHNNTNITRLPLNRRSNRITSAECDSTGSAQTGILSNVPLLETREVNRLPHFYTMMKKRVDSNVVGVEPTEKIKVAAQPSKRPLPEWVRCILEYDNVVPATRDSPPREIIVLSPDSPETEYGLSNVRRYEKRQKAAAAQPQCINRDRRRGV